MAASDDLDDWRRAPLVYRRLLTRILYGLFRLIWRLRVTGLENVPVSGPVIVAGNHVSNLDGPLIAIALCGRRYMRAMGKVELFRVPVLGWFLHKTGVFPVDRRGDITALRTAAAIVSAGGLLAMMPEGTRSKDGKPGKPRPGVAFLAALTKAPVVPARLVGTDRWPFVTRVEARFGSPMRYQGGPDDREACIAFAQTVMDAVFRL